MGNVWQKWEYCSPLYYKLNNQSGWIARRYILCEEGRLDYSTVLIPKLTHSICVTTYQHFNFTQLFKWLNWIKLHLTTYLFVWFLYKTGFHVNLPVRQMPLEFLSGKEDKRFLVSCIVGQERKCHTIYNIE